MTMMSDVEKHFARLREKQIAAVQQETGNDIVTEADIERFKKRKARERCDKTPISYIFSRHKRLFCDDFYVVATKDCGTIIGACSKCGKPLEQYKRIGDVVKRLR